MQREQFRADATAAVTTAVSQIPDSMASAVMAGLNPAQGLHAAMVAAPVGALTGSSVYMMVTTTGAMSLATGVALAGLPEAQKLAGVVVLTLLVGLLQIGAGAARLGFVTHYVSNAVMTGFLAGVAVLIVLTQLAPLTGLDLRSHRVLQPIEVLARIREIAPATLLAGAAMIAATLALDRTPARKLSMLIALVAVSVGVALIGARVELVGHVSPIPRGLPQWSGFAGLDLATHVPALAASALAIAIIGLVQGAAVGQSYPQPDGSFSNSSRDFLGQGAANAAAAAFSGMPVGGSAGSTALNVAAGAATRWANVLSGIVLVLAVLACAPLIERVPTAALAGLLVLAGLQSIRPERALTVWRTGGVAATVMSLTFGATLLLPVQQAVFLGVVASILMATIRAAERVRVMELVPAPGVLPLERPAPALLRSHAVTVLLPYGSLFFAGARTLEESLPHAGGSERAVVVLLLRGHHEIGSTFIGVVQRYAQALQARGGRLILAAVGPDVAVQLRQTGTTALLGEGGVVLAGERFGEPLQEALAAGNAWLAEAPR